MKSGTQRFAKFPIKKITHNLHYKEANQSRPNSCDMILISAWLIIEVRWKD